MTETTTETAPTTTPEPAEDTGGKPGREAARYRTQLREAEAERDTLRERVTAMQRAEAERLAGLAKGSALWAAGTTLDDLLDDDGNLDPEKVSAAATAATDALGLAPVVRTPAPDPTQGTPGPGVTEKTFTGAFAPRI